MIFSLSLYFSLKFILSSRTALAILDKIFSLKRTNQTIHRVSKTDFSFQIVRSERVAGHHNHRLFWVIVVRTQ